MVAVIEVGDITRHLDRRSILRNETSYSVAERQTNWHDGKPHLALLLDENNTVRWLGRAQGRKRVSDRERRVDITEIKEVPNFSLEELRGQLPKKLQASLKFGLLSDAASREALKALNSMFPELSDLIRQLSRPRNLTLPRGNRGLALNEQRDGTGLVLEMAGIGREPLESGASISDDQPSFLAGIEGRHVSEESLIDYDVARLPGLVESFSYHVDWRVFGNKQRKVLILNANMEPLANTLGVDVLYYNQTFKSFVLVQYKRMTREDSPDGEKKLWHRPDKHLAGELDRMQKVDELYGNHSGNFRLFSQACWLKLCDPSARIEEPTELIKGMYLARELFVDLLDSCKGPRGGVRIGYENVPRHINNTLFTQLVKDGWIGTTGIGTSDLEAVVREVLQHRRPLVLGFAYGDTRSVV